ncbi:MAG: hypothetical protein ACRD7E_29605 [Bryobacteraceae bacterium]
MVRPFQVIYNPGVHSLDMGAIFLNVALPIIVTVLICDYFLNQAISSRVDRLCKRTYDWLIRVSRKDYPVNNLTDENKTWIRNLRERLDTTLKELQRSVRQHP